MTKERNEIDGVMVLWDIDGTLVKGDTRFIWRPALTACCGRPIPYPDGWDGKTDMQIVRDASRKAGLTEEEVEQALSRFTACFLEAHRNGAKELRATLERLPGVEPVLEAFRSMGVTQTVLTGNIEPTARMKLEIAGLDGYLDLDIGAYGSDHEDRNELVHIARRKAAAQGLAGELVVVGDTPRDIACARAGGARIVSVATGGYPAEALRELEPDALLTDLTDMEAVRRAILGNML